MANEIQIASQLKIVYLCAVNIRWPFEAKKFNMQCVINYKKYTSQSHKTSIPGMGFADSVLCLFLLHLLSCLRFNIFYGWGKGLLTSNIGGEYAWNMEHISCIFYARVCAAYFDKCGSFDIVNVIRSVDDFKTNLDLLALWWSIDTFKS